MKIILLFTLLFLSSTIGYTEKVIINKNTRIILTPLLDAVTIYNKGHYDVACESYQIKQLSFDYVIVETTSTLPVDISSYTGKYSLNNNNVIIPNQDFVINISSK